MIDFMTYDFGYSWLVRNAMIVPLVLAAAVVALGRWRSWPSGIVVSAALVACWAAAATVFLNAMLNGPMPLPTERFLRSGSGSVLDVGAGSGRAATGVLLARPGVTATGVDIYSGYWGIDDNTPERFMKNARIAGVANRSSVRVGDMRQLPFGDGKFDAVVSAYAIDHLRAAERPKAIAEVARVLKPGGEFLLLVVHVDWRTWLVSPLLAHHPSQPPEPWRTVLRENGLTLEEEGIRFSTLYFLARKRPAAKESDSAEPDSRPVTVASASVLLNPQNGSQTVVGDFHYAGGIAIEARDTDQLHGISDLEITGNDRLVAVTDFGSLIDARLTFDAANRLVGVTDARIAQLRDENGALSSDKADADAEGIALLPNGDRLVSFERRHRILLYPAGGGPPRRVPAPEEAFPANGGMEALGADPDAGDDAYIVGAEVSGNTWSCQLGSICRQGPTVDMAEGFGLVAMRRLPGSVTVDLLRAFDEARGTRVSLQIVRSGKVAAQMDLAAPLTVDNYEGVAVVPRPDGGFRFYLMSDVNANAAQRTLLVAFDWRPR